jgi:hypothetical protein
MLSADLAASLLAALLWAAIDVARVGSVGSLAFPALFGSTALILGVGVVSLRRAGPFGDGLRAVAVGAALASLPLALLAAVLQRSTHHRALGGVTFAFVAALVIVFAIAVSWRMLVIARRPTRMAIVVRALLVVASIVSCVAACALAITGARPGGAPSLTSGFVDGLIGAALLGLAFAGVRRLERSTSRFGAVAWICVVAGGAAVAASDSALCAALAERAPVAFAIGAGCGG